MVFDRTFHPDEANQAFTTGHLLETGRYTYQPQDHHGPTLYYAAAAIQRAAGHTNTATLDGTLLRCTPLVFAVLGLVFGFVALKRLTKSIVPGLMFALLLGTSPFFAFFATDFIQEVLLASFLLIMFWAGAGYLRPGAKWKRGTWALFFGTAAGLAFATKETCLISFAAAAFATVPFLVKRLTLEKLRAHARDGILAVLGFLIVACILYSDFGRDFHGVYNAFIAAPLSYLGRAAGNATASTGANWHVHPWWQYALWLFLANPCLLALFMFICPAAWMLRRRTTESTFNAFQFACSYALVTLAIYSLIPYKTPWCAVQIEVPLVLAVVLGLVCVAEVFPSRRWLPLAVLPGLLLFENNIPALIHMNRDPDSTANPCNYAAASPEVKELAATVATAMESQNQKPETPFIAVALPAADTWPFPWYNRPYESQTGYWISFEDLVALQKAGVKPSVVIVPMEEGHLVQPLFPHLTHTKRFYMRPRIPERQVKGMRVRVFW